jgi:hypothetical protein
MAYYMLNVAIVMTLIFLKRKENLLLYTGIPDNAIAAGMPVKVIKFQQKVQ